MESKELVELIVERATKNAEQVDDFCKAHYTIGWLAGVVECLLIKADKATYDSFVKQYSKEGEDGQARRLLRD